MNEAAVLLTADAVADDDFLLDGQRLSCLEFAQLRQSCAFLAFDCALNKFLDEEPPLYAESVSGCLDLLKRLFVNLYKLLP